MMEKAVAEYKICIGPYVTLLPQLPGVRGKKCDAGLAWLAWGMN